MTARVIIVRHGNTFAPGEPPRRIGARTDLPLVESGRAQARRLAAYFATRGIMFDQVLAGDLRRTRETASLVAPGRPIATRDWLREIDHGPDEDRIERAVEARIGAAALLAWDTSATPPPGWIVDAEDRIAAWRAFLGAPSDPGTTLLVTSNGAARFARLALGLPAAKLRTGAFADIGWYTGQPELVAWDVRPD